MNIRQGINDPLYSRDASGRLRVWRIELEGSRYRTISGLHNGAMTMTGWTNAIRKNVGRSNETTLEEQALLEVTAAYKDKLGFGYVFDVNDVGSSTLLFPMLAKTYKDYDKTLDLCFKNGFYPDLHSQPKLDGMRCVARADGLWSRNGKPIIAAPHIFRALEPIFEKHPNAIFDGELYNHDLKDDFNAIISHAKKTKPNDFDLRQSEKHLQYHIYDLVNPDKLFSERSQLIYEMIPAEHVHLKRVRTDWAATQDHLDTIYATYLAEGYEGQMIRLNAPYEIDKRSAFLLKRKEFLDAEFEVSHIVEGTGNWAGYAKMVLLKLPQGGEFGSGIRGSQEEMRRLLQNADSYRGKIATVRYQNLTPDLVPRFPVVVAFHEPGPRD